MLEGDIEQAVKKLSRVKALAAPATYAASKVAVHAMVSPHSRHRGLGRIRDTS
jgi:hypothetical protein